MNDYNLYVLIALGLSGIILIVVYVTLKRKNNKLLLKVDEAEYATAIATGKLNKLSLEFMEKDTECEQAKSDMEYIKRKRDNKGRYIPRKKRK